MLEHGKPHERSTIIEELTGKIVEMSQQKFASNVVEKCLAFGSAAQRQLMVDEMLGLTDENEPLQVCFALLWQKAINTVHFFFPVFKSPI